MQEAFRRVWDANIQKNFEGLALFEKGGSYTALVGAFGEFQAALLFEYVNQVAANSLMIPLISNSLKSGEQAKADVTILQQVGIQVKNYNPMSSRGLLETNIHPSKIQQYGAAMNMEMFDSDFMDFLANYFFNRTYQEENSGNMQLLEDALGMFFGDLANLAVADSINDTVSFYVIEGQYFVPGSYILEAIEKNDTVQKEVTITGPSVPYGDEDYESVEIRSKKRREGYFSRWWTPSNGSYTPTQYNYSTYEGLINSKISIRSGFNYNKLNIPRFSIY